MEEGTAALQTRFSDELSRTEWLCDEEGQLPFIEGQCLTELSKVLPSLYQHHCLHQLLFPEEVIVGSHWDILERVSIVSVENEICSWVPSANCWQ